MSHLGASVSLLSEKIQRCLWNKKVKKLLYFRVMVFNIAVLIGASIINKETNIVNRTEIFERDAKEKQQNMKVEWNVICSSVVKKPCTHVYCGFGITVLDITRHIFLA